MVVVLSAVAIGVCSSRGDDSGGDVSAGSTTSRRHRAQHNDSGRPTLPSQRLLSKMAGSAACKGERGPSSVDGLGNKVPERRLAID